MSARRALVFGGSGTVGREVVRGLAAARVATTFTYHRAREAAEALARELDARALAVDLADAAATRALVRGLDPAPDLFIHCAAVSRAASLAELSDADWLAAQAINAHSAFAAIQELAPRMAAGGGGDIVLVGALDRTHSVPVPVHFAATQGQLSAMTMALAKELGDKGIRVNMIALGVLEGGLSRNLDPKVLADFKAFSALRRVGTAAEAAKAIVWLALENTYVSGKVVPVNGGI